MMKKFTRTISGVTPIAVMAQPLECPGQCIYCPSYSIAPKSYTPESPAVLRGIRCNYNAKDQVKLRLKILSEMGHPTDKVELIVMGGTFLAYDKAYQYQFIKDCYDALNDTESVTLEEAKQLNETADKRCTGLCIETRPDWCRQEDIEQMLKFGTTRVELGVQMLDDRIYQLIKRGHTVKDVIYATKLLKNHGLKVHYHWMPGLPGSTPENDLSLSAKLFTDNRFRPDGLKIYPTMVVAGTELEKLYREGYYEPYENETMIKLIIDIKSLIPRYVRISRLLRDIPTKFIVAGLKDSLRDTVRHRMIQQDLKCKCIRCREYGHRLQNGHKIGQPRLVRMDYEASNGQEIFLSFEDENETLFGLLRMRIQSSSIKGMNLIKNHNYAIIRELHVFGFEVPLNKRQKVTAQHKGLGKALIREAERIVHEEFRSSQIAVLSGVGAREYYRAEFGYQKCEDYMMKML